MTDHDALVAAICAEPEEDTPRLVYADFLEENGESDRAAFIRAQVELARTPEWEPFAVYCKWRRKEWITGWPFRDSLPAVDGNGVEWNERPFRRGLGWHLNVRSPLAWDQCQKRILANAPIGAMHLWNASTLDQWRAFAESPILPRLRELRFVTNPIEPLRALRDRPAALGVADIYFKRASSPAMSIVVDDLLASPLGKDIQGLHFHMGYEALDELMESLAGASSLERLSLTKMGVTGSQVSAAIAGFKASRLTHLDLRANPLGEMGLHRLLLSLPTTVRSLGLSAVGVEARSLALSEDLDSNLRRLDLSGNLLTPRSARNLSGLEAMAGLQSLDISKCRAPDRAIRWITRAKFWPKLVELNLAGNPISAAGVRHLLDAPVPVDLTALVMTEIPLESNSRTELERKYGERLILEPGRGSVR